MSAPKQHRDSARFLAEFHGVQGDEPVKVSEAIEEGQAYRAAVEATDTFVIVVPGESLQRMDTSTIIREEAVSNADDYD